MRENDLFELIGDIDSSKIEEAYNAKPKNLILLRRLSFAACFILIAVISFSVVTEKDIKKDTRQDDIIEKQPIDKEEKLENPPKEEKSETSNDIILPDTKKTEPESGADILPDKEKAEPESDAVVPESSAAEDDAIEKETSREESSDQTSDMTSGGGSGGGGSGGGGSASYENRFSVEYLNSLNEKITEKASSEEFSFVVSSRVNEDTNRVEVVVTSMEKDLIDKIKVLDTQGGAIEFKSSIVIQ